MKNICIITQCSLPVPTTKGGAVETLVEYIIEENEHDPKYNITVLSVYDEKAKIISDQYKHTTIYYVKKRSYRLNKILFGIYRVLKHLEIYIPFSLEFIECLQILKKLDKQDIYLYEAGPTTQLPMISRLIDKEKLLVHLHWDGMGNRKKDKCFRELIPISSYIGKTWCEATKRPIDKTALICNCTKIDSFQQKLNKNEIEQLKEQLGINKEDKVLIFVGRIVQDKGVRELLQAIELIQDNKISVIVIGSANFGEKTNTSYEQEVKELGKNSKKNIIFMGYIHQTELYKYYSVADIAIMPSLFQEPAGLVCIEAQAASIPLIATNVGGISEYINKEGSILIEKDDNLVQNLALSIETLLRDETLRINMGYSNSEYVRYFNTSNYFKNFCKVIDRNIEEIQQQKRI